MQPNTVLLDLDGVVRHFDPAHVQGVEARHDVCPGQLVEAAFEQELLDRVITGRMPRSAWVEEVGRRVGNQKAAAEWMAESGKVDQAMLAEVAELRSSGIVVAILTNGTDTIEMEMELLGLSHRFDAIFNSAAIGFAKPDRRAFERVCLELDIDARQVFFTDDSQSKLGGAIEIGMTTRLFEGVAAFQRHLVETGIKSS